MCHVLLFPRPSLYGAEWTISVTGARVRKGELYKQIGTGKCANLNKLKKLLGKYNLQKMTQKEMASPRRPVIIRENGREYFKGHPHCIFNLRRGTDGFMGDFYQIVNEQIIPIS